MFTQLTALLKSMPPSQGWLISYPWNIVMEEWTQWFALFLKEFKELIEKIDGCADVLIAFCHCAIMAPKNTTGVEEVTESTNPEYLCLIEHRRDLQRESMNIHQSVRRFS